MSLIISNIKSFYHIRNCNIFIHRNPESITGSLLLVDLPPTKGKMTEKQFKEKSYRMYENKRKGRKEKCYLKSRVALNVPQYLCSLIEEPGGCYMSALVGGIGLFALPQN